MTVHSGDTISQQKGYDNFVWDEELKEYNYDFNFVEDESVFEKENPRQKTIYIEQVKTILSEFYKTADIDLQYQIALRLPKELDDYPEELKTEAKAFLLDKAKQDIPTNISELDKVQNIESSFLRKLLLKTKRLFTKDKGITLKQR